MRKSVQNPGVGRVITTVQLGLAAGIAYVGYKIFKILSGGDDSLSPPPELVRPNYATAERQANENFPAFENAGYISERTAKIYKDIVATENYLRRKNKAGFPDNTFKKYVDFLKWINTEAEIIPEYTSDSPDPRVFIPESYTSSASSSDLVKPSESVAAQSADEYFPIFMKAGYISDATVKTYTNLVASETDNRSMGTPGFSDETYARYVDFLKWIHTGAIVVPEYNKYNPDPRESLE